MGLLFISSTLTSVRVFVAFMLETVLRTACKCRFDFNSVLLYVHIWMSLCVHRHAWVGSVLLNFQRIQKVHTLLQHITLWHTVVGMVHTVLTQLSLPFYTSLFSFTEYFLLLLNMHFFCSRLHFIGKITLLRGCFSKSHKLVIIQSWKSLLDQCILLPQSLRFILDSGFFFVFFVFLIYFLKQKKRVKLSPGHKS